MDSESRAGVVASRMGASGEESEAIMRLYLISQDVNNSYDTFDSAVVCAESEEDARSIHPLGGDTGDVREEFDNWVAKKDVRVQLIGEATVTIKRGVICASFNAG